MSNFNELIKQKVEQFNVPYNDAHWAEMEGKLNKIRSAKIRNNSFIAAGTTAVIAIFSAIYFNAPTAQNKQNTETTVPTIIKINETTSNQSQKNNQNENNTISSNLIDEENNVAINASEEIEEKTANENNNTEKNESENTVIENNNTKLIKTLPNRIKPTAKFIVFNNQICLGEEVSFEANETTLPASYFWDFGDGTTSKKQNPNHIYSESGKYDVTLIVTERKSRTEAKHTVNNAAIILPKPKATFSYSEDAVKHDNNKLKYPYTSFKNKEISNNNTYSWNFGNGQTAKSTNPSIIYNKKGTFPVMLTVKNSYGCVNSITKNIEIKNAYNLFAPNAFTPDNDGENDEFIPKALLGWEVQFEMTITDLSNKVVYKTSDKNEPWKGSLNNNGSILPPGIYLWKVITYDANGKNHQHVGKVNLLD